MTIKLKKDMKESKEDSLVQSFKERVTSLRNNRIFLEETEPVNEEILEKLQELTKLKRQIDKLQEELDELTDKYSNIIEMPELKELVSKMEDRFYKFNSIYGEYVLKLQKGYTRTTYAYADVVKTLAQVLPKKHQEMLNKLLESTKKVSTVADKLVLEQPKSLSAESLRRFERRLQEDSFLTSLWNKLVSLYDKFVNYLKSFFRTFDDDLDELEFYMKKDMEAMVEL